jgi:hypothetical protein
MCLSCFASTTVLWTKNYSMAEVDLLNRDPNELNGHIKVILFLQITNISCT